jgi:hypothetical protein
VIGVIAGVVTWGLIALSLALLLWTFSRTTRWRAPAHKLARQVDLVLPGHLEPVVMRYVRNQCAITGGVCRGHGPGSAAAPVSPDRG